MTTPVQSGSVVSVRCQGSWEPAVRTALRVRHFAPFYADEPESLGGQDTGPNPMEYLLGALNSCVSVMIHLVAAEIGFRYEAVELVADGVLDVRGMMGDPEVQAHFLEVRQTVRIKSSEARERLEMLKEKVESRCPAASLINAAKVPLHTTWEYLA